MTRVQQVIAACAAPIVAAVLHTPVPAVQASVSRCFNVTPSAGHRGNFRSPTVVVLTRSGAVRSEQPLPDTSRESPANSRSITPRESPTNSRSITTRQSPTDSSTAVQPSAHSHTAMSKARTATLRSQTALTKPASVKSKQQKCFILSGDRNATREMLRSRAQRREDFPLLRLPEAEEAYLTGGPVSDGLLSDDFDVALSALACVLLTQERDTETAKALWTMALSPGNFTPFGNLHTPTQSAKCMLELDPSSVSKQFVFDPKFDQEKLKQYATTDFNQWSPRRTAGIELQSPPPLCFPMLVKEFGQALSGYLTEYLANWNNEGLQEREQLNFQRLRGATLRAGNSAADALHAFREAARLCRGEETEKAVGKALRGRLCRREETEKAVWNALRGVALRKRTYLESAKQAGKNLATVVGQTQNSETQAGNSRNLATVVGQTQSSETQAGNSRTEQEISKTTRPLRDANKPRIVHIEWGDGGKKTHSNLCSRCRAMEVVEYLIQQESPPTTKFWEVVNSLLLPYFGRPGQVGLHGERELRRKAKDCGHEHVPYVFQRMPWLQQ